MQEHSLFSTPSLAFIVCRLFDDGHSDWCEVVSHCNFDLHFCNNERCWTSFHVFVSYLYVFFGEMSVWVLCSLFDWLVFFFFFSWYWAAWAACIPYDPTIPLLSIYPEETRNENDTCIPMFISALFTIVRTGKQPRCPSTDKWIRSCGTYTQWNITQL